MKKHYHVSFQRFYKRGTNVNRFFNRSSIYRRITGSLEKKKPEEKNPTKTSTRDFAVQVYIDADSKDNKQEIIERDEREADFAKREADFAKREADFAKREADFAKREAEREADLKSREKEINVRNADSRTRERMTKSVLESAKRQKEDFISLETEKSAELEKWETELKIRQSQLSDFEKSLQREKSKIDTRNQEIDTRDQFVGLKERAFATRAKEINKITRKYTKLGRDNDGKSNISSGEYPQQEFSDLERQEDHWKDAEPRKEKQVLEEQLDKVFSQVDALVNKYEPEFTGQVERGLFRELRDAFKHGIPDGSISIGDPEARINDISVFPDIDISGVLRHEVQGKLTPVLAKRIVHDSLRSEAFTRLLIADWSDFEHREIESFKSDRSYTEQADTKEKEKLLTDFITARRSIYLEIAQDYLRKKVSIGEIELNEMELAYRALEKKSRPVKLPKTVTHLDGSELDMLS
jgi:hypothetical protein